MLNDSGLPNDLVECVTFHGHICPGLVYGYRVAKEAARLLDIKKSEDEEVVCICENDSCSVDAFQVLLSTTAGKGNLIINNYGKNVYQIFSRKNKRAFRFSRIFSYTYTGENQEEFQQLEAAIQNKTATPEEMKRQKFLKAGDLAYKPFDDIFEAKEIAFNPPPYASLAPSVACDNCGELTMKTKMITGGSGTLLCTPCSRSK